jgi:PPK2 family polyphosphate:nucleotide phosphotransferase
MSQSIVVSPGTKIKLKDYDPDYTGEYKQKKDAEKKMRDIHLQMIELQSLLYAESRRSLLIILQAMDTGGKDGTIKHVMGGVDPQGCEVVSFKVPTPEELSHDFLWRAHKVTPGKGKIVIFNRSYYEDVLVVRVHDLVPKDVWSERYEQINYFENCLTNNNTLILKFFLHISKDEQKKRLEERLKDPTKHWKISLADLKEREYWDDYMDAYNDVLTKCSTEYAPWSIIPANKKWYRNLVIGETIVNALKGLNMKYPEPKIDVSKIKIE